MKRPVASLRDVPVRRVSDDELELLRAAYGEVAAAERALRDKLVARDFLLRQIWRKRKLTNEDRVLPDGRIVRTPATGKGGEG